MLFSIGGGDYGLCSRRGMGAVLLLVVMLIGMSLRGEGRSRHVCISNPKVFRCLGVGQG
jgi:hypothetical protein